MVDSVHHLSSSWDSPDAKDVDFIYPHLAALFAKSYAESANLELMDPQISPTYGNLEGLPPVLVDVGECEMLRGAAEQLYVLMRILHMRFDAVDLVASDDGHAVQISAT